MRIPMRGDGVRCGGCGRILPGIRQGGKLVPVPVPVRAQVPPKRRPYPANFGPGTSVLVVCLDSLRRDHVTPELMPNLCDFLDHGHRFEGVLTPRAATLHSTASMLFGREDAFVAGPENMVGCPSIAGRLAGTHATAAFLGLPMFTMYSLRGDMWFFRDFGQVVSCPPCTVWTPWPIAKILPELDTWRAGLPTGLPWFAYLHLSEVHVPYMPREWYGEWESPPESIPGLAAGGIVGVIDLATGKLTASAVVGDYLRRRYAEYCRRTDVALAPLWAKVLAEKDLATIVVSDHGEGQGEGGVWCHSDRPAFQRPEIRSVLFGAVPPGGRWPRGIPANVTTNADLWRIVEACLPRGPGSDEAEVREKLAAIGYLE